MSVNDGYFWYIKRGPDVDSIGLVDEDGQTISANKTAELHVEGLDPEIEFEPSNKLRIHEQDIVPFMSGVLYDLLQIQHAERDDALYAQYLQAKRHRQAQHVSHRYAGGTISPHNLRGDAWKMSFRTKTRDEE